MKLVSLIGALLVSGPALAQTQNTMPVTNAPPPEAVNFVQPKAPIQAAANPWDIVPPVAPYRNLADQIRATSKPGQASPLNPSCEGERGDQCVRSAEPPKR